MIDRVKVPWGKDEKNHKNGVKRTWNNMKKAIRGKWCTFCIMGQRVIEIYKSKGKQKRKKINLYRPETEWANYDQIESFRQKTGRSNT